MGYLDKPNKEADRKLVKALDKLVKQAIKEGR